MKTITRVAVIPTIMLLAAFSLATQAAPKEKVQICHKDSEIIEVSANALDAHLGHGDHLVSNGGCRVGDPGDGGGEYDFDSYEECLLEFPLPSLICILAFP